MPATNLFAFLTSPNPKIPAEPSLEPPNTKRKSGASNTKNPLWHFPKRLTPWKEFQPELLNRVFSKTLFNEAQRVRPGLPPYPRLIGHDVQTSTHDKTVRLINKWTESIVNTALEEVCDTLRPALWDKGTKPPGRNQYETARTRPDLRHRGGAKYVNMTNWSCDSGANVGNRYELVDDKSTDASTRAILATQEYQERLYERFPKEYKQYQAWNFQDFQNKIIGPGGEWYHHMKDDSLAWPVRQAYSYCLQNGCRYGCILTPKEALIFRVKPTNKKPVPQNEEQNVEVMESRTRGLKNPTRSSKASCQPSKTLTVSSEQECVPGKSLQTVAGVTNSLTKMNLALTATSVSRIKSDLSRKLSVEGVMEYVHIPWTSHWSDVSEACLNLDRRDWTINLAFWYLHILAGNNYCLKWKYIKLEEETLAARVPALALTATESASQVPVDTHSATNSSLNDPDETRTESLEPTDDASQVVQNDTASPSTVDLDDDQETANYSFYNEPTDRGYSPKRKAKDNINLDVGDMLREPAAIRSTKPRKAAKKQRIN